MIDKGKVTQAIKEMVQNPDWKEVLMNAPGAANLRIALAFYASKNLDKMSQQEKDEYREFRETLESQLNADELKYLTEQFGRMGVEAARSHYQELLQKKGGGQDQGGNPSQGAGGDAGQPQDAGQGGGEGQGEGQDEDVELDTSFFDVEPKLEQE